MKIENLSYQEAIELIGDCNGNLSSVKKEYAKIEAILDNYSFVQN